MRSKTDNHTKSSKNCKAFELKLYRDAKQVEDLFRFQETCDINKILKCQRFINVEV